MLSKYFGRVFRQVVSASGGGGGGGGEPPAETPVSRALSENLDALKELLGESNDMKTRALRFGPNRLWEGALVFFDGMVNNAQITDAVLRPLTNWAPDAAHLPTDRDVAEVLSQDVLCSGDIKTSQSLTEAAAGMLSGDAALFVEGCAMCLVIGAKGWDKRGVTEPTSESVVRGPREGFTESLRTNTALIRRKIQCGKLRSELVTVGRKTRTAVCLMYLDGVANPQVLKELRRRIGKVEVDSILESGNLEQYIEDAPFSPFPTVGYTEKPDVAAGRVLEGRIAVVVDGTPFVLTVPMLVAESFQSAEDYYVRTLYASGIRLLRYFSYMIAVFAPAVYVALVSFHQELLPTTLLFTVAQAREGTPFPVVIEMLIMVFAFEVLRESGIRLPKPVGQAISIVGALVMGDAAISAGLVGAPVVITIAITAVAGFMVPMQNDSISLLRPVMMVLAASFGFYGLSMGFFALLVHISTLTSFGVPCFDGFSWTRNLEDSVIRMPLWTMTMRPKGVAVGDTTRRRFAMPPMRPHAPEGAPEDQS